MMRMYRALVAAATILAGVIAGLLGVDYVAVLAFEAGAGLIYGLTTSFTRVISRSLSGSSVVTRLLSGIAGLVFFPVSTVLLIMAVKVVFFVAKIVLAAALLLAFALILYYVFSRLH